MLGTGFFLPMNKVIHGRSKALSNESCPYENADVIISYYLRFLIDTRNIAGSRKLVAILKNAGFMTIN